jgi:ribosomal protein S18 acetylase RimI-like enzyme
MPDIKLLAPDEWLWLQNIRLAALQDSPHAFLATYEQEKGYDEGQWRAEFSRGDWYISVVDGKAVSLLGATSETEMPPHERYIEYLWVSPECRRSGIARSILINVIDRLRGSGVRTVYLWVLDGNEVAIQLYETVGFVGTNHRQDLPEHPARGEERMRLDLSGWLGIGASR